MQMEPAMGTTGNTGDAEKIPPGDAKKLRYHDMNKRNQTQ